MIEKVWHSHGVVSNIVTKSEIRGNLDTGRLRNPDSGIDRREGLTGRKKKREKERREDP